MDRASQPRGGVPGGKARDLRTQAVSGQVHAAPCEPDRFADVAIFRTLPGEFITHLDGYPTTSFRQLYSDNRDTTVRWIAPEPGRVHYGRIYIRR